MKKIFLILIFSTSLNIQSSDLKSLESFLIENDMNDAAILEYIAKRCSASNLAMTRWTTKGDGVYEVAFENYIDWYMTANMMRGVKFPNQDKEVAGKNIIESIVVMTDEIDGIMKYSQDIRGSIWEGNFLVSDLTICKSLKEDQ